MSYVTFNQSAVTGVIDTITGNTGGAVGPGAGHNIDFVGSGYIAIAGNPATNTLTVSFTGPLAVADGGTGLATITDHSLVVGSGTGVLTELGVATDGQLAIGSTGVDPVLATLTSTSGTVVITNGAGSIDLDVVAGSGAVTTLDGDTGSATPVVGVININGSTNITTSAATSAVTISLDTYIEAIDSVEFNNGGLIVTKTNVGDSYSFEAYDTSGAVFTTFATLTAGNPPTMDLDDAVTKNGNYIYRANGTDVPVTDGGTGASTLLDHGVLVGSGTAAVTPLAVGTDGQVLLGSTGADPVFATLTSTGGTIDFTTGAGLLNLETNGIISKSFVTDVGTATPALGVLTVAGGTNINTAGAISTVTVNLDTAVSGLSSLDMATGGRIGTATSAGNTLLIQAYDVDGGVYATFATLTAANDPSMNLADNVTKGGGYIYRAGGTDVPVSDGGTGASSLTDHGVLVGSGAAAVTALAVGATNEVLLGSTGADPTWGSVPNAALTNSSITLSNGNNITITGSPVSLGGTATVNVSGTTQYALQVGDATGSLDSLAVGSANQILQSGGAGSNPAWSTATYPATTSQGDILYSSSDNTLASLAKDATATRYLANTGTSNNPAWDQVNLANGVTGTLPVGNGGTGVTTFTDHGVLVGSGASAPTALTVGTDGQVLLGSTGADPVFATLASSGSTIAFTPGAGTLNLETGSAVCTSASTDSGSATPSSGVLTIAGGDNIDTSGAGSTVTIAVGSAVCDSVNTDSGTATPSSGVLTIAGGGDVTTSGSGSTVTVTCSGGGGGLTWNESTGSTQAISVNNGYIANYATLLTFTLPATASVGDVVRVIGLGDGGFKIAQNASQYIQWDESTTTTTGTGGYLASTDDNDAVELICTVTNNGWGVLSSKGNITVV